MPVRITKLKGGRYRVRTPSSTTAKSTTKRKAKAQKRLLNALEHNKDFKPRSAVHRGKKRKAK